MTDEDVRARVLRAIAANRTPGFHFPGHLLAVDWPLIAERSIVAAMNVEPAFAMPDGAADLVSLCVLIDTGLATAPRVAVEVGARQATVSLTAQFTGEAANGALEMRCAFEGFTGGPSVRHALTRGALVSGGRTVCHALATFIVVPPPQGVTLAPLPWQRYPRPPVPTLTEADLDEPEREIMATSTAALKERTPGYIERFWGARPVVTEGGATCRVAIGPHIGNRVGHVQGGVLLGVAGVTARAAVPRHPMLSGITACYISPGRGDALHIESSVLHSGRSFAVVRTEVKSADGARVLEVVSNHAAAAGT